MNSKKSYCITIDGPAGAGKSTISKLVAQKLGWLCLDTGALYRAFTVKCLDFLIDIKNEEEVKKYIDKITVSVKYVNGKQETFVNGENVTNKIRSEIVSNSVFYISKILDVRKQIVKLQRQIANSQPAVIEGRDIGTVVIPNSVNKFYITASPEIRAKRRYNQLTSKGESYSLQQILKEINERDKIDTERKNSPLRPADDAKIIDTSSLSPDEVVKNIISKIKVKENNFEM